MVEILGLIPARSGSKGIPRKNLAVVAGRPLVTYTLAAAVEARSLTRRLLSTDDPDVARLAERVNIEAPFLRPEALSNDDTPMIDVVLHCLSWLAEHEGYRPDVLVLLQPTAPLRRAEDIDGAVDALLTGDADSVVSVAEVPSHYHRDWQLAIDPKGYLRSESGAGLGKLAIRRQDLSKAYTRNGAVYAVWRSTIERTRSLYGDRVRPFEMPPERSVNVDDPQDLVLVEWLVTGSRR